ncbi:uncharacterized protein DUF2845 [Acidovorax delafieldii]|uniref:Uncharacterized protein DUF2845 n=1 Tax=Acidovorax delafieldii TaxID=47920 RepID=A0A561XPX2_ACIDE|nr:uncharacterized protein DUF2845 [Acidovorax sp. 59]PKW02995.1 uncharacterized protein DUF2845 [Acidovorax sp. 30]TWG38164.1 uncharacterized protein DUF2845 [Acidovorax delafieldii]
MRSIFETASMRYLRNQTALPGLHQRTLQLVATALALCTVLPAQASQSLRCNGSLVGKGDSPVTLLQKCGDPIYRQGVCVSMLQLGWVVTPYRPGSPAAVLANQCVPMEEWTYDRGPGTFLGVVRIYNGTIESVRDGDRSR